MLVKEAESKGNDKPPYPTDPIDTTIFRRLDLPFSKQVGVNRQNQILRLK
jgi:hypothetical protein